MIGGKIYGDRMTLIKGGMPFARPASRHAELGRADRRRHDQALGTDLPAGPHANVIDARHRIACRVRGHARHTWQTPVRGVLPSCTPTNFADAEQHRIRTGRRTYRQPDGRAQAERGTTLLDWSHVNNTPEHADAAVAGLTEAGIRAVYAHGVPVGSDCGLQLARTSRRRPADPQDGFQSDDQLLTRAGRARQGTRHRRSRRTTGSWRAISPSGSACTSACGRAHEPRAHVNQLGLMGPDTTQPLHRLDRRGAT
jgi:hypothetical protein